MLQNEYVMFPTPFRDKLNIHYFPLTAAHRASDSKISGAKLASLSLKFSWINVYYEIYDGWIRTAGIWGKEIILLDQQLYQKFSATRISFCQYADNILPNFLAACQKLRISSLNVITNIPYKSQLLVHKCRILLKRQMIFCLGQIL